MNGYIFPFVSTIITPGENIRLRIKHGISNKTDSPLNVMIPAEDSFWYWIKTYQYTLKKSRFILFFDQFEELFTYPKQQVEEFSEQLSQLLYNTIPVKFRKRLDEMDEASEISDELHSFLYDKPEVKVVFSVRSDRLSQLNGLTDRHPAILYNCYELDALNPDEAIKAITVPASLHNPNRFLTPTFSYTDDALKKILENTASKTDKKTDLSTLQIICRYVEDELVNQQKHTTITSDLLGDITNIFKLYYQGILNRLHPKDRENAQRLIEDELLEGGHRNPLPTTYIQKFGISDQLLQQLEDTSIIRKERDAAGRIFIELSHDALVIPVTEARNKRIELELEEKNRREREEKRRMEAKVNMWQKARELDEIDKKGFRLIKSETLKRKYGLFINAARIKATKENLRNGLVFILIIVFLLFSVVWSVIATYKFIRKENMLENNAKKLEERNQEFQQLINTVDSVKNPVEYKKMQDLLQRYKTLQKR
jgi:hypothetical protein